MRHRYITITKIREALKLRKICDEHYDIIITLHSQSLSHHHDFESDESYNFKTEEEEINFLIDDFYIHTIKHEPVTTWQSEDFKKLKKFYKK